MQQQIQEIFSGLAGSGIVGKVIPILGIAILTGVMIAVVLFFAYYKTFNITVHLFPLYGSTRDGTFSIGKRRVQKVKYANNRTCWKQLWPLLNRKKRQPFDDEFQYLGKPVECYAYVLNDQWIPIRLNAMDEGGIRGFATPVPTSIRNWQAMEYKENARELAEHNFWNDNKQFILILAVSIGCLAAVIITIYLAFGFSTEVKFSLDALTGVIKQVGVIPAAPPGG